MQVLYTISRDPSMSYAKAEVTFKHSVKQAYKAYLLNVYFLLQIAKYAIKDDSYRKNKLLPTEQDKLFEPILTTNPIIENLSEHEGFFYSLKEYKLLSMVGGDTVKKIYNDFVEHSDYLTYATKSEHTQREHLDILMALYRFCTKHELFNVSIEDYFANWEDDESLVVGATKKTLKALPTSANFHHKFIPDRETVDEYGVELLYKVVHLDEDLLEVIKPFLKNWDVDRVAVMDMILLKMAVCELLHFPTIPTKVTINEYIDISKAYSTPKSKEFVNGILDQMLKQLNRAGKIKKTGRGLIN